MTPNLYWVGVAILLLGFLIANLYDFWFFIALWLVWTLAYAFIMPAPQGGRGKFSLWGACRKAGQSIFEKCFGK